MKGISDIKERGLNWFLLPVKTLQGLLGEKKYKLLDVGSHIQLIKDYLPNNIIYDSTDCSEEYSSKNTFIHNLDEFPMPVKDHTYDIIMCLETLEHSMYPHKIMKELIRISKPETLFILSLPNDYNIIMRIYYLFGIKKLTAPPFTIIEEHGHIHTLRKKDILEFYKNYLDIDKLKYTFSLRNNIASGKYSFLVWFFNLLSPIFPNLFARNIGVCGTLKTGSAPFTHKNKKGENKK